MAAGAEASGAAHNRPAKEADMQLVLPKWAPLLALAAALIAAWLIAAPSAEAASTKYHITNLETKRALELSPSGVVKEAAPNSASLRQQWIKLSQPGGTALYGNAATAGTSCIAAPNDAVPTSVNKIAVRSCFSTLDKRLHWTLNTGVPGNAGVLLNNVHTKQVVMPELCIGGPCFDEPALVPADWGPAFGSFAEWRFKILGSV
jgi:hypothetical protein